MANLYDRRLSRRLTPDDLPSDISLQDLGAFLDANGAHFHSLDTLKVGNIAAIWDRDPERFRVGTSTVPSRGIDVPFDNVRAWIAKQPEVERQVRVLERAGAKLAAAALGDAPAHIDQDEAILLHDMMVQFKALLG